MTTTTCSHLWWWVMLALVCPAKGELVRGKLCLSPSLPNSTLWPLLTPLWRRSSSSCSCSKSPADHQRLFREIRRCNHRTMGQNHVVLRHLIIHFSTSSGVSEQASKQMRAAERASEASSAKQASGRRSCPGLMSWFLAVLNHCVLVFSAFDWFDWKKTWWRVLKQGF